MYSYKNPFSDFDTNVMSAEQISEFFTEPYDSFTVPETKITGDKSPIIFVGGRGTGKTMLLRQFSYNVQKITTGETYINKIKRTKYIGVYFRVDRPLLQSLSSLGQNSTIDNFEEMIFTHFFELTIFKEYLEIVKILTSDLKFEIISSEYQEILEEMKKLLYLPSDVKSETVDDLIDYVMNEINYIWYYQSQKAIDIDGTVKFSPKCNLMLQGRLSDEFCRTKVFDILGIKNTEILLLIDEFESFSEKQQMVINAAMRYNKDYGMRLRIGMRPYGFKTYDTVNSEDYIKEGRDYSRVEFDNPLVKKTSAKYIELVRKITDKRLSAVSMFEGKNIIDILGAEEDYEEEAKDITKGQTKHFDTYLREINRNKRKEEHITLEMLKPIRDENPLYEMTCLRLLLKGKSLEYTFKAFNDYKNHIKSPESKKFNDDYSNKYKLSFLFVLCSIYRKERKCYYSFNDYCHLSSGIIGYFIELCRHAFDLAYFRDSTALESGKISKEIQTDAAYEVSYSERDMVKRIAEDGEKLYVLVRNLGSAFSHIHKDIHLRYPETNMVPINIELSEENQRLLNKACMWSLVLKKPNVQSSNSNGNTQDMFLLNRIFAPVYKISYRTRGGFNPIKTLSDDFFSNTFVAESVLKSKTSVEDNDSQLTLLDFFEESEGV